MAVLLDRHYATARQDEKHGEKWRKYWVRTEKGFGRNASHMGIGKLHETNVLCQIECSSRLKFLASAGLFATLGWGKLLL
jgi:hypothetical protein